MTAPGASAFRARLAGAGLDLLGALPCADYDALVPPAWRSEALHPEAQQWIVVASGGPSLFEAFQASAFARDGQAEPLDRFVRASLASACDELGAGNARSFHYHELRGGAFADFVALGRACGLGSAGALGISMHAKFGPWWSIRAVVGVVEPLLPPRPLAPDPISPCRDCAAPCVTACRGDAVLGPAGDLLFKLDACAATRALIPACAERCDARRACPVGAEAAYSDAAEAHHMRASLAWIAE